MHISTYQKNIYILKFFKSQSLKKNQIKEPGVLRDPEKKIIKVSIAMHYIPF